jgi:hypothetical protein
MYALLPMQKKRERPYLRSFNCRYLHYNCYASH